MRSPADMSLWTGRDDTATEGPDALRIHQCIKPWNEDSPPGVCLLGFACDEGVRRNQGRVGAAEGPTALRKALANLAWDKDHILYDAGDVRCTDGDLEAAQDELGNLVASLIRQGQRPITLGGGHETAWGSFLGLTEARPDSKIGVINLDAHFDLRESPVPHSGTPFRQMAAWYRERGRPFHCICLGIAEQSNTKAAFRAAQDFGVASKLDNCTAAWSLRPFEMWEGDRLIDEMDYIFLSIDLDVLPRNVMPAVSAPSACGVPFDTVEGLIDFVALTGKLSVADVVEFNPRFDRDGLAARTAARLIWTMARRWSETPEAIRP
jgi:formiminoglutamase